MPETLSTVIPYTVSIWALVIALLDTQTRRIPNVLTLGVWVVGSVVVLVLGRGVLGASSLSCLLAVALGLLLTVPAYALRMLGAADVKLIVAIGLIGGLRILITAYVAASLLAGAILMAYFLGGGHAQAENGRGRFAAVLPHIRKPRAVPFGAALAVGLLCAIHLPMDWLFISSPD